MNSTIEECRLEVMPCAICGVRPARLRTTRDGQDAYQERLPCEACERLLPCIELRVSEAGGNAP